MAILQRTRVLWTGFQGAPGISNFFARIPSLDDHDPTLHMEAVASLFEAVGQFLPHPLAVQIDPEVNYYDDGTGELEAFRIVNDRPTIELPSVAVRQRPYAGPAGGSIQWLTGGVRNNRRVRGTTFLVPLTDTAFQNDGSLSPAAVIALVNAGQAYLQREDVIPVIWARPTPTQPGISHEIITYTVPDRVAVLKSRRD